MIANKLHELENYACVPKIWKIKNKNYNKRGRVIGFWNIIIKWWIVFSIYFLRLLYIVWKLHLVRGASHTQNSLMRKTRANIMHIRWHRLLFPYAYAFCIGICFKRTQCLNIYNIKILPWPCPKWSKTILYCIYVRCRGIHKKKWK